MKAPCLLAAIAIAALLVGPQAIAEESKFVVGDNDTIASVLKRQAGKSATLKLLSGQDLSGVVEHVADHVVHLRSLKGMEFYDAVVELDDISAVVVRTRNR